MRQVSVKVSVVDKCLKYLFIKTKAYTSFEIMYDCECSLLQTGYTILGTPD